MNRTLPAILVALACGLAILLLIEARGGKPVATVIPHGEAVHKAGPPARVAVSSAVPEIWVRTILDRPIFSPSRRPGSVAVASTELPRLAGIIVGPEGARAIFAGSGDGRAIVATAGGRAGPYLIRSVGLTGVSVIGPNGAELLQPVYDHDQPSAAGMPVQAGPPSILDLLRSRVQTGANLNSSLLPPSTFQLPARR